jgi:hypothetical protein
MASTELPSDPAQVLGKPFSFCFVHWFNNIHFPSRRAVDFNPL